MSEMPGRDESDWRQRVLDIVNQIIIYKNMKRKLFCEISPFTYRLSMEKDILKENFTKREYVIYGVIAPLVLIAIMALAGWLETLS